MPPYRLDFVQCLACGHVWNRAFRYEDVPYGSQPNLMFNAGVLWNRHLAQLVDYWHSAHPYALPKLEGR
jgi:hypothetical protein